MNNKDGIHIYYMRDCDNHPYACVAFSVNEDGTVNRGISWCSVEDNFSKKVGRRVALGRLAAANATGNTVRVEAYRGRMSNTNFPYLSNTCQFKQCVGAEITAEEKRILASDTPDAEG